MCEKIIRKNMWQAAQNNHNNVNYNLLILENMALIHLTEFRRI